MRMWRTRSGRGWGVLREDGGKLDAHWHQVRDIQTSVLFSFCGCSEQALDRKFPSGGGVPLLGGVGVGSTWANYRLTCGKQRAYGRD
jgi:hypothetical protein